MNDDKLVALSIEHFAKKFEMAGLQGDPTAWIKKILGEFIWSKQSEVMDSVRDNKKTSVRACHGVGKSFIASRAVIWWLATHPAKDTLVITTAPTAAQVTGIIWQEIAQAHRKAGLAGNITGGSVPQWKQDGQIMGEGRSPSNTNEHNFQGRHKKFLFIVIDEACGIAPLIWEGCESMATGEHNRMLAIGNPTDPSTKFRDHFKPGSDWNQIHIDALQSPNLCESEVAKLSLRDQQIIERVMRDAGLTLSTEEVPDEIRENLTSAFWVAEKARIWGVDSALWLGKVRGEFPDMSDMGAIPLPWVEAAVLRWEKWAEMGKPEIRGRQIISCDVAASVQGDKTCIAKRVGNCITDIYTYQLADTMKTSNVLLNRGRMIDLSGVDIVMPEWQDTPFLQFIIDGIGVGRGVFDRMTEYYAEMRNPNTPEILNFVASQATPARLDSYAMWNKRAHAWWSFRKMLDPAQNNGRGSTVMLPPHDEMIQDLTTPKWSLSETGNPPKLKIESKDDIRKRLDRSPDVADAIVMAFLPDGLAQSHMDDWEPTERDEGTARDLDPEYAVEYGVSGLEHMENDWDGGHWA